MAGDVEIAATGLVPAPAPEVFGFLADLENHWLLADRFIEVVRLQRGPHGRADGGRVRLRGPLWVRRTAATRVLAPDPPRSMVGVAELGGGTRAFVRWELSGMDRATRVRLEATIERTGRLDRILLRLGGRSWLERRFGAVLQRLARRFLAASAAPGSSVGAAAAARNRRIRSAPSSSPGSTAG